MVTGGDVGAGGSTYYPFSPAWGIMYADSDADCDVFYQEILSSGMGCMKPALVRRLVEDSRARYRELQNWGLSFRSLEDIRLTTCFGAVLRGAVLDDVANLRAPFLRQLQRRGVRVLAQLEAIDLCVQDGRCCGLLCAGPNGETVRLAAGAVVLATAARSPSGNTGARGKGCWARRTPWRHGMARRWSTWNSSSFCWAPSRPSRTRSFTILPSARIPSCSTRTGSRCFRTCPRASRPTCAWTPMRGMALSPP